MLPQRYLVGVDIDPFEGCPGVVAVSDYRHAFAWRYVATYADGKRHKARIFALLARHKQRETPGHWELHHIVEGQHFADVDFTGALESLYREALPCVLIHRDEHVAYNQLLHIKPTDEMFRDRLPSDALQRSASAVAAAKDKLQHGALRQRVARLRALYSHAYAGDRVLQQIADNVLATTLESLR